MYNCITLIGNLGADPEIKKYISRQEVCYTFISYKQNSS